MAKPKFKPGDKVVIHAPPAKHEAKRPPELEGVIREHVLENHYGHLYTIDARADNGYLRTWAKYEKDIQKA